MWFNTSVLTNVILFILFLICIGFLWYWMGGDITPEWVKGALDDGDSDRVDPTDAGNTFHPYRQVQDDFTANLAVGTQQFFHDNKPVTRKVEVVADPNYYTRGDESYNPFVKKRLRA